MEGEFVCFIRLESATIEGSKRHHIGHPAHQIASPDFKPEFAIFGVYEDAPFKRRWPRYYWINLKRGKIWRAHRIGHGKDKGKWWRSVEITNRREAAKLFKQFKEML